MSRHTASFPQCYLADLEPGLSVTPPLIREAWLALERNRERYLARRTTESLIENLAGAASLWLAEGSPFMRTALELGPQQLGFSARTLEDGLTRLFGSITRETLQDWIEQDLGHLRRLDDFCATGPERSSSRRSRVSGPPTLAHVTAGNIPAAAVLSMVAGLMVRSAQFVKCARGSALVPRLFAHSLREVDPHHGACIEVAEWPGRRTDLLEALIEPAECVTATGSDRTVRDIRNSCPVDKRFIGHPHRVSFAFLSAQALGHGSAKSIAGAVAVDVAAWNQRGCLSPHGVYVEEGGEVSAESFAAHLAESLQTLEQSMPRGEVSDGVAATIRARRGFYEVRAAHSSETKLWQSRGSTAWTVVYEADPRFQVSCLDRFVYVKGVPTLEAALQGADSVRRQVSTVALAAPIAETTRLASRLAEWGASRVCPAGSMQRPPASWRHDGRPVLSDLVRWTDLEHQ